MHVLDRSAIAPVDDPDNDVLRDFVKELRDATTPFLRGDADQCECSTSTVTLSLGMDDVLLTSAEWEGEYENSGRWGRAIIVWRLRGAAYVIRDGRNTWNVTYSVDVENPTGHDRNN